MPHKQKTSMLEYGEKICNGLALVNNRPPPISATNVEATTRYPIPEHNSQNEMTSYVFNFSE